jgi:uncharacterized membrane protein YbhN (UPF0104 family)
VPGWAVDLVWVLVGVVAAVAVAALALELWERYKRGNGPDDDYVERWWNLLGLNASVISRAVRGGHAILAQPRYMVIGLTTAAVSWLAQIIGIHWTLHAYGMETGIGVAGLVFLASTLVGLFPIVPGNVVVFQGATVAALTFATNVSADAALTFSIGLALIEAALGVGLGFFFLSYEGLSLGELRREAAASESRSVPS